jgi:hypothetical protein
MMLSPIADEITAAQGACHLLGHHGCGEDVVDLQAQTADAGTQAVQALGILEMDQSLTTIIFIHADLEDADHAETPHTWHETGWAHGCLRHHRIDRITYLHA